MTRLIDADNFKMLIWMGGRGNNKILFKQMFLKIIEAAPTVEAIPVEFIEKQMRINGDGMYKTTLTRLLAEWREREE